MFDKKAKKVIGGGLRVGVGSRGGGCENGTRQVEEQMMLGILSRLNGIYLQSMSRVG